METELAHNFIAGLLDRLQGETAEADRRAGRVAQVLSRGVALRAEAEAELARIAAQREDRLRRGRASLIRDSLD